ncbi:hypothetical protein GL50803_008609 [Giardia duodenalis]|uniref:Uncharacterized protein n=1 Tax=Giardia intestinalis (strain ATCC 50803 / WB clone C6) TaxID=184922 RepID=A8B2T0_GIAIC|nr:hypothetical protein GL50803_008609 [Giardia intestinalis]KAE8303038.1 hypothetical protein GL50803_008609 [Giardia intestinalis]|eukprot:XP_001710041.1 Hypothetical protein GL50803_8609 [Giardia lamblia ATCC 50803]
MFCVENTLYSLNNRCSILSRYNRTGQWEATYKRIPSALLGVHSSTLLVTSSSSTAYIYHPATGNLFHMRVDTDVEHLATGPAAEAGTMTFYRSRLYLFLVGSEGKKPVITECRPYVYDTSKRAIITQGCVVNVYPLFSCTVSNSLLLFGFRFDHRGKYITVKKLLSDRKAFSLRNIVMDQPKCDDFFFGFVYRSKYVLLLYHHNLKNLLFVYNSQTAHTQVFPSPFNEVPKTHACLIVWEDRVLLSNDASVELPANLPSLLEQSPWTSQGPLTLQDIRPSECTRGSPVKKEKTPLPRHEQAPIPSSPSTGRKVYRHSSGLLDVVKTTGYKVIENDFEIFSTASSSVSRSATLPLAPIEPLSEISVQIPAPTVELSSPTQSEPHPRLSDRVLPVRPPSVTKMIAEGSYTLHPLRADEPSPLEAAVAELRGELEVLRGGLAAADERGARLRGSVAGIQEGLESLAARCAALEKGLEEHRRATAAALADLRRPGE